MITSVENLLGQGRSKHFSSGQARKWVVGAYKSGCLSCAWVENELIKLVKMNTR